MNRNSKYKKIAAVATATSLMVTSLVGCQANNNASDTNAKNPESTKTPVSSETEKTSSTATRDGVSMKEETVYVKADASGTTNNIIVSNWLKNGNGSTVIDDISNLKDIVNVKGDETFTADGANLNWAANGSDIYYQGTTKEELPVGLKITYHLDGKEISPNDLAGKSGHVKIRFDYTNNEKQKVTVDGKQIETVVPFAVLGGTLLDSEKFTNVTVTNGKVISDGNNTIVAGFALPGLQDSLVDKDNDLLKDLEIPSYIEMEADVTDFEISMTMSVVLNNLLKDVDVDDINTADDLKSKLDDMTKGYDEILNGAKDLSGYMEELEKGVNELAKGSNKLTAGSPQLNTAASDVAKGISSAQKGSAALKDGAGQLYEGASTLSGYTSKVADGVTDTLSAIDQLVAAYEGSSKEQGLKQGASDVSDGASQVNAGVTALNSGLDTMYETISNSIKTNNTKLTALNEQVKRLKELATKQALGTITAKEAQELVALSNQKETITTNIAALSGANKALEQIKAGIDSQNMMAQVDALNDGTKDLATGAKQISAGINKMYGANVKLQTGLATLKKGADGIDSGAKELATNLKKLDTGAIALDDGLIKLDNGYSKFKTALLTYSKGVNSLGEGINSLQTNTVKLNDGAKKLYDGTEEFKKKAIDKINDAVNENFETIKEKLTAVVKADQSYHTYSGANENMESSVKFIIETDKISNQ